VAAVGSNSHMLAKVACFECLVWSCKNLLAARSD
jgi:hypothetical protein